ncbi:Solute carrier family 35 member F2 [Hondaea fermentalgiana]|uniref:Solute carrier family 35 member F2 n=1 Tax=Hondaea fermentalgiana TaxID=2315210 RepID=A0A2R5GKW3_9STRA|nr:Solute carrier family 35 member F2 [Hondaea fermentalgiana]|eukprot:GBG31275.1 Solute carrier family 35 member F2 [Hondaea fermentalgiana]
MGGGCRTCWRKWHGVVLGQLLSLLLTGTGVFSEALFRGADVSVPGLQNFIMYAALATIYGAFWFRRARRKRREQELAAQFRVGPGADSRLRDVEGDTIPEQKHEASLAAPWYVYALIALADVQGNFLAVLAYRYTTIASATLLDCFSIPVVMVLSRLFLRVTYGRRNFAGVLMCLCGLSMVVLIDLGLGSESETRGSNPALGDALVVLAASCYAVSNVAQEVMVKRHDRIEYLFLLGSFGCFFAGIQVAATEHETLSAAHTWPAKVWTFILGYVVCLFGMYSSISKFLETFDAAFLNISLLSSDVWAVFAGHLIFHDAIAPLYVLALLVIVGGVLMYNSQMPEGPAEARERQYSSGAMNDLAPIEISDETPRAQSRFENLALAQS